ncbi:serine endopeptidase [Pseudoduganella sp. GCM10020061]|uniref:serine endopeptidase n=1 Tax=Pseudoduganella sp. GCM10020061 TaxID=3317345 RepID=UPI00363FD187
MSKGLRLSEKWFQRGLWLVAVVFAFFLIGLGGKIVENLRFVEPVILTEQFIDPMQGPAVRKMLAEQERRLELAVEQADQAALKLNVASNNYRVARETFGNWLKTRQATARPDQDAELIARTRELDALKAAERIAQRALETQEQARLDAQQAHAKAVERWNTLEFEAVKKEEAARTAAEFRIFMYRLALTLPLLVAAGWLFAHKRKGTYWPFVWGFIFFALFAFFVELVPYLPSYGGYVRYTVGIILTFVVGRYAILALQRYLARQKAVEELPDEQRRGTMQYDVVMARLAKSVCPGCERQLDLKDPALDFCPHCGINLFDHCGKCNTRKGAFARFCFACGTPGKAVARAG